MIVHDPARHCFTFKAEGIMCVLNYVLRDGLITIEHTRVPPALGGRGIASELTQAVFEFARASGFKIIPACSYAAVWAKRHPAEADILA
jgi:uncharacterized protein